jgi:hypothetical protein
MPKSVVVPASQESPTRPAHTIVEGCLSTAWQERLAFVIAQVEVIGKFLYGFSQGMLLSVRCEAKQGKHNCLIVGNRHYSQPHRSSVRRQQQSTHATASPDFAPQLASQPETAYSEPFAPTTWNPMGLRSASRTSLILKIT